MSAQHEVVEGRARLLLPEAERATRGPGAKEPGEVFFNPAMAVNRDLACLLMRVAARDGWSVLDGLAATGVRGLRYALETGVALQAEWNDWNPAAARLIAENAKRNGVEPRVENRSLAALLHERVWNAVDVDPYGSPAPFLDAASRAVRHGGLLGLTATDTMALAGVYPAVALRRYHGLPMHGELGHEIALRLLAAAAVRAGARHDVGYAPVLAHATDYYYRVVLRASRGATRADAAMTQLGHAFFCRACGERGMAELRACPRCGGATQVAGPLWAGPLVDAEVADEMAARESEATFARGEESRGLLGLLREESRAPPLFFDLHKSAQRVGVGSGSPARIVASLRERGYSTWRVHFNPLALRTDAPARDVMEIVRAHGT